MAGLRIASTAPADGARMEEETVMVKTFRRIAIALGSLAALALAGGAHWRVS